MRRILERIGLVVAIGGVAMLCMSSTLLAAIVGAMTAAIVAIDMLAIAPRSPPEQRSEPDRLSVDLTRRR